VIVPRPTRFLRLPDCRPVCLTQLDALAVPVADHVTVTVTVTVLEDGREIDMLAPKRWQVMRPRDLGKAIVPRLRAPYDGWEDHE
jgi:hypothetical protein